MPRVQITLKDGSNRIIEFEDGFTDADIDEVANQLNSQIKPVQKPAQQKTITQPKPQPQPQAVKPYNGFTATHEERNEHRKQVSQQKLNERKEWEAKHPIISGIQKDYQPGYRAAVPLWEMGAKYGVDAPLKERVKTQAKTTALNLVPAVNLAVDIATGGSSAPAKAGVKEVLKQGAKTGAKTGLIGGATQGVTSSLADNGLSWDLLQRPLMYGGTGLILGAPLGAGGALLGDFVGNVVKKAKNKAVPQRVETSVKAEIAPAEIVKEVAETTQPKVTSESLKNEAKQLQNEIKDLQVDLTPKTTVRLSKQGKFWSRNIDDPMTKSIRGAEEELNSIIKEIQNNPLMVKDAAIVEQLENRLSSKLGIADEVDEGFYNKFYEAISKADEFNSKVAQAVSLTKPQTQETATRGGIKTVKKYLGDDAAKAATDTEYLVRGREINKAEFESLPFEKQQELINNADDLSDLATYAKAQHISNQVKNGNIPISTSNSWLKGGTEKAQALQAQRFLAPDTTEGALVAMQNEILKSQPKHVKKIVDNTDKIVKSLQNADGVEADKVLQTYVTNKKARKSIVDKVLELQEKGELTPDNFYDLISKKYNIPKINENDYKVLTELTDNIRNAATDRERVVAEQLLAKNIAEKLPVDWSKREQTYRTINMLLSPKSRSKDAFSTALYQGERALDEAFAMIPAKIREKVTGIKTRVGWQPEAWIKGVKRGFKEVNEDVKLGINTGRSGEGSRFDLTQFPQFENVPVLKDFEKWLNYSIKAIDRPFYEGAFESSLVNQMKARGLTEPTEEIIEQAVKEAKEAVFQGDSLANNISTSIRGTLDNATGPLKLGQRTAPFITTVSNLTTEGLKSSPFGLFNANLYKPSRTIGQMRDKDLLIGKMLKGATTYGPIGAYLALNGDNTNIGELGSLNTMDDVSGLPAQGIAIGNKAFSLANMPQATIPISIYKALLSEGTPTNRVSNAVLQAGSSLTDLPAFQGIGNLIKGSADVARAMGKEDEQAISDATNNLAKQLVTNYVSQEIPLGGTLGNIRNAMDPERRELMVDALMPYVGNRIANRLPFLSENLPQKYNVLGQESKVTNIDNGVARAIGETIDPINIRNYVGKPYEMQELDALTKYAKDNDRQGASNLQLSMPKRKMKIDGEKVMLNNEEYSEYSRILNQTTYNALSEFMNSDYYQNLSEEQRINRVKDIKKFAKEKVDYEVLGIAPQNKKAKTPSVLKRIKAIENKASKNYAKGLIYSE